jgi:hypothetical protein
MIRIVMIFSWLSACFLCGSMNPSQANEGKVATMPDFCQTDSAYGSLPNKGRSHCGPAAVSNALLWQAQNGWEKLLAVKNPSAKDHYTLIQTLGSEPFMNTHETKGTGPTQLMNGIKKYVFEKGYRAVIEYMGIRTNNYRVGKTPRIPWILRTIKGSANLVLNVGWCTFDKDKKVYTRIGGHFITVAGYETGKQGKVTLLCYDPATRCGKARRLEKCQLVPLPSRASIKFKSGATHPAAGLYQLKGIKVKSSADIGILDGAIAFTLLDTNISEN